MDVSVSIDTARAALVALKQKMEADYYVHDGRAADELSEALADAGYPITTEIPAPGTGAQEGALDRHEPGSGEPAGAPQIDGFDDDDMAEVGRSFLERVEAYQGHSLVNGWPPVEDPAAVIDHLLNAYDELHGQLNRHKRLNVIGRAEALQQEVRGLAFREREIREVIGNTNWQALQLRLREMGEALNAAA